MTPDRVDARRVAFGSIAGTVVGGACFLLVLFDLSTDLGRTALGIGFASDFFDTQAQAILGGHLWVPSNSLGIEGFIIDGHTYAYFGLWPSIVRIPILLVTHDFDGRMTVTSMLVAFVLYAVMAARLLWLVRYALVGRCPVSRTEAVLAGLLLALATGGTTLTFDASLPWAYHEIYLWQTAFVVAALYWMLRTALDPSRRSIVWLGAAAMGAALTRVTGGWAVCAGILVLAAWIQFGRSWAGRRGPAAAVLLVGLVPLAVAVAVNMAKFGHPYMFPLADQVWTQVNAHRRVALRVNGGSITGPQFFLTSLRSYFTPTGVRFVDYFPWVTLPATNARPVGGAYLDQSYRTGSVTAFMPLLLLLALASLVPLLRRSGRLYQGHGLRALRPPAVAAVLMTGGVMGYGYVANRYTSEFVPALVLGSSIALWAVVAPVAGRSRRLAIPVVAVVGVATAYSLAAQSLVGLYTAATTYGGAPLGRFLTWQQELSGGPGTGAARLISTSDGLPSGGATDDLHIRGACDGLYLNLGDRYEPWLAVEERSNVVVVHFPRRMHYGEVPLFTVRGDARRQVVLQTLPDGRARVGIVNEGGRYYGQYVRPSPGESLRVGMRTDSSIGYLEVSSTPGGFVGYLPLQEWRRPSWISRVNQVVPEFTSPATDEKTATRIVPAQGLTPPLCQRLARVDRVPLAP